VSTSSSTSGSPPSISRMERPRHLTQRGQFRSHSVCRGNHCSTKISALRPRPRQYNCASRARWRTSRRTFATFQELVATWTEATSGRKSTRTSRPVSGDGV
jgi:hypothetical protein